MPPQSNMRRMRLLRLVRGKKKSLRSHLAGEVNSGETPRATTKQIAKKVSRRNATVQLDRCESEQLYKGSGLVECATQVRAETDGPGCGFNVARARRRERPRSILYWRFHKMEAGQRILGFLFAKPPLRKFGRKVKHARRSEGAATLLSFPMRPRPRKLRRTSRDDAVRSNHVCSAQ
jgi:hypothetical protein